MKDEDQGKGNNDHVHISEDEGSYSDHNDNANDLNDNQQHDYDSLGDWTNKPEVDKSDDDSDHDPNDIGQPEDAVTISRRSHIMNTQSRLGNIVHGQPSVKNDTLFWKIVFANPTHIFLILSSRKPPDFHLI